MVEESINGVVGPLQPKMSTRFSIQCSSNPTTLPTQLTLPSHLIKERMCALLPTHKKIQKVPDNANTCQHLHILKLKLLRFNDE